MFDIEGWPPPETESVRAAIRALKQDKGGYFTDYDLLLSLGTWIGVSASWSAWDPGVRPLVTVEEAIEADIRLRLAALTQAEDLTRLIETTGFRTRMRLLLKQAWG